MIIIILPINIVYNYSNLDILQIPVSACKCVMESMKLTKNSFEKELKQIKNYNWISIKELTSGKAAKLNENQQQDFNVDEKETLKKCSK